MTAGDKDANSPANKEDASLRSGNDGADSGAKEQEVESTTRTAGKNPNKAEAPQKTPPNAKPKNQPEEPSVFGNNLGEFLEFLAETWQEFRKISWPNREQVIRETWSVIVLVTLITGSVLAFDFVIAKTVFEPLDKYAKKVGGGVGHTTSTWGPLAPRPGAPVNNPGVPGNIPATPLSLPGNTAPGGTMPAPSTTTPAPSENATPAPAPSSSPAPAPSSPPPAPSKP